MHFNENLVDRHAHTLFLRPKVEDSLGVLHRSPVLCCCSLLIAQAPPSFRVMRKGLLTITLSLYFLAPPKTEALEGPSCSVEVCGSRQQCSSGQTCSLCQGHTIVCTCFVGGIALGWTNGQFSIQPAGIPFIGPMDSETTSDSATGAVAQVTNVGRNGATVVNISSTLTLNVTSDQFNGTRIGCYDISGVGNAQTVTLELRGSPPARPTVQFTNPGQSFTVSWNNITSPFNGYTVTVSPFNPCTQSPDVSCNTAYVCSGWSASNQPNMFEFSVSAVCGSVVGSRSAAASVNLQVPNPPTLTITPLYDSSGGLLEIESQANVGSPVTTADGVDSSPTEYIFSYNGSPIPVSTGSTPQCTNSSCQHAFRVTSSQAQQYTVTVGVRNVVGVGTESTPVTVGSTNNIFNVTVDVGARVVTCWFLNGLVTSATCTIQYGTDPTYVNLPNTDSSTGTNVNSVTVPLSTPLQTDTLYYYVVSFMGVQMQGSFRSGCTLADLGVVGTTADERCIGLLQNSAQFPGGVVCYSGVTPGSLAVYVCNSTHHLEGPSLRECQSNGNWSGFVPQCVVDPPQPSTNASTPEPTTCSLGDGAVVGISVTIFLVSFSVGALLAAVITYCCCVRRREKSSGQPHPSPSEGPQPAPLYDEVIAGKLEVKENVAYGPVDALEMKKNPSYGPVRH